MRVTVRRRSSRSTKTGTWASPGPNALYCVIMCAGCLAKSRLMQCSAVAAGGHGYMTCCSLRFHRPIPCLQTQPGPDHQECSGQSATRSLRDAPAVIGRCCGRKTVPAMPSDALPNCPISAASRALGGRAHPGKADGEPATLACLSCPIAQMSLSARPSPAADQSLVMPTQDA